MNKAALEALGLTAEAINKAGLSADLVEQIIILHGKGIEKFKGQVTQLESQLETANGQLTEANKAIADFKKMDIESIQKSAADWETKYKQSVLEGETKLANLKLDFALESALVGEYKARDPKDLLPHIKRDALKLGEDGKLSGLDDQVKALLESKPYLFNSETSPRLVTGGGGQPINQDAFEAALMKGAGLTPQSK